LTSGECILPPVGTGGYSNSVIFMTFFLSPWQGFGAAKTFFRTVIVMTEK